MLEVFDKRQYLHVKMEFLIAIYINTLPRFLNLKVQRLRGFFSKSIFSLIRSSMKLLYLKNAISNFKKVRTNIEMKNQPLENGKSQFWTSVPTAPFQCVESHLYIIFSWPPIQNVEMTWISYNEHEYMWRDQVKWVTSRPWSKMSFRYGCEENASFWNRKAMVI